MNQHVIPIGGRWGVRGEADPRPTRVFDRQAEAIDYARHLARRSASELVIHGRDGRIREKSTYGRDPFPPKG